jgi:hypothetical protein
MNGEKGGLRTGGIPMSVRGAKRHIRGAWIEAFAAAFPNGTVAMLDSIVRAM